MVDQKAIADSGVARGQGRKHKGGNDNTVQQRQTTAQDKEMTQIQPEQSPDSIHHYSPQYLLQFADACAFHLKRQGSPWSG